MTELSKQAREKMWAILSVGALHDARPEKSVNEAARALFCGSFNVGPIGDVEGRYYHRFAHRPLPDGVQEFPQIVQDEILQLLPLS